MGALVGVSLGPEREVLHVHVVDPGLYRYDGGVAEEPGEYLSVERSRGDYDLEFRAACDYLLQRTQNEVDVQAALVGFVHHDDAVAGEQGIRLEFLKQHSVGEDLDPGVDVGGVVETHLVAAVVLRQSLRRYLGLDVRAYSERGYAPGLGDSYHAAFRVAGFLEDYGYLRCLSGSCGAFDYDDLIRRKGVQDHLSALIDRKLLEICHSVFGQSRHLLKGEAFGDLARGDFLDREQFPVLRCDHIGDSVLLGICELLSESLLPDI